MKPGEVQWLSNHMGHDVGTHIRNYRLHDKHVELTKVGRILTTLDDEASFSGKPVDVTEEGMLLKTTVLL